jgi:hypothetical protein
MCGVTGLLVRFCSYAQRNPCAPQSTEADVVFSWAIQRPLRPPSISMRVYTFCNTFVILLLYTQFDGIDADPACDAAGTGCCWNNRVSGRPNFPVQRQWYLRTMMVVFPTFTRGNRHGGQGLRRGPTNPASSRLYGHRPPEISDCGHIICVCPSKAASEYLLTRLVDPRRSPFTSTHRLGCP